MTCFHQQGAGGLGRACEASGLLSYQPFRQLIPEGNAHPPRGTSGEGKCAASSAWQFLQAWRPWSCFLVHAGAWSANKVCSSACSSPHFSKRKGILSSVELSSHLLFKNVAIFEGTYWYTEKSISKQTSGRRAKSLDFKWCFLVAKSRLFHKTTNTFSSKKSPGVDRPL